MKKDIMAIVVAGVITAACSIPMAKEFYQFKQADESKPADIHIVRRPPALGNMSGTMNVTTEQILAPFTNWTGANASSWSTLTGKPDVAIKYESPTFNNVSAINFKTGRVTIGSNAVSFKNTIGGDSYLNSAVLYLLSGAWGITIAPGSITTNNGLFFTDQYYTGLTLKSLGDHKNSTSNPHSVTYAQLPDKPTIPAAQVPADWNSIINPTQILNKPIIPEACGTGENAIFDGAPALSCAIDSGSLAFTYDSNGANPLPAMLPYTVKLYEVGLNNNEPVTPDTIKWSVPTSNSLLVMGQYSTQSTFTPNILGNYSANRTNWIKATLTRGLKTCIAMVPVSVTKQGPTGATGATGATGEQGIQGEQGPPGDSPTITKPAVQGVMTMDNPGGTALYVRPDSSTGQTGDTDLIVAGDTAGNERLNITANGVAVTTFNNYSGYTGYTGTVLAVNKKTAGYAIPLTNAWSERFTAIRSNSTVAVTAGKTYTETITLYANGTITAASINFNTPNGDHVVPAYISTASAPNTYTLTATYTTETGDTAIRMPDITYLAGTATSVTISGVSLVQQKTNLIQYADFANLRLYGGTGHTYAIQADGSMTLGNAAGIPASGTSIQAGTKAITNGQTYQLSMIASLGAPSVGYWTAIAPTYLTATQTTLGNQKLSTGATYTTVAGDNTLTYPGFFGFTGSPTTINIISMGLINTAEAQPPTTNLYNHSLSSIYHYTAAHTTAATATTLSTPKFTVSDQGVVTLW